MHHYKDSNIYIIDNNSFHFSLHVIKYITRYHLIFPSNIRKNIKYLVLNEIRNKNDEKTDLNDERTNKQTK